MEQREDKQVTTDDVAERPEEAHRAERPVAESLERLGSRWSEIQAGFVDEPKQAVQRADQLVAEVIQYLADERGRLEEQWSRGDADTEQLRVALQSYRKFFGRLLEG